MYQKIVVVGNVGSIDLRYLPSGDAVCSMSVASNRRWMDKETGEKVEETVWFRCSVWGAQAETCNQYLGKGSKVLVEGRLQADPATGGPKLFTRHDGTIGASFEIRAFEVKFLSSKDENEAAREATPVQQAAQPAQETEDEDIPF